MSTGSEQRIPERDKERVRCTRRLQAPSEAVVKRKNSILPYLGHLKTTTELIDRESINNQHWENFNSYTDYTTAYAQPRDSTAPTNDVNAPFAEEYATRTL